MEPLQIVGLVLSIGGFLLGLGIFYYVFDKKGREIDAKKAREEREQRAH